MGNDPLHHGMFMHRLVLQGKADLHSVQAGRRSSCCRWYMRHACIQQVQAWEP